MRVLAFIRAMRWKGLIITAVVTAVLGLMLTLYSCKPGSVKTDVTETRAVDVQTLPGGDGLPEKDEANCTATACTIE